MSSTPDNGRNMVRIAAILALIVAGIHIFYFFELLRQAFAGEIGRFMFSILFRNTMSYAGTAALAIGGIALLRSNNWGWLLVTGVTGGKLLLLVYSFMRYDLNVIFALDSLYDATYLLTVFMNITLFTLLLLPNSRRSLKLDNGKATLAVLVGGCFVIAELALSFIFETINLF
jgi:hypothetical protein